MSDPQYRTNDGSAVRIWRDTVRNPYLSEREGRPVYDEAIFVEVISPGSRGSSPVFEVERTYAPEMGIEKPVRGVKYDEYAMLIDNFKAGQEAGEMVGTPLEEWPAISRSMAASLREGRIFTVEALAALPDNRLSVVGPDGRTWRDQAQAYLATAKDASYAATLAAELAQRDASLADKDRQIAELAARVQALETSAAAPAAKAGKAAPAAPAAPADTIPPII